MTLMLSRFTRDGALVWQVHLGSTPLTTETDERTARAKLEQVRAAQGNATVQGWDGDKGEYFAVA